MSRYFVNRRAAETNGPVVAAVSFLFVASAIFMSAVTMQSGPEALASALGKQMR
jgi:hypothetical protein